MAVRKTQLFTESPSMKQKRIPATGCCWRKSKLARPQQNPDWICWIGLDWTGIFRFSCITIRLKIHHQLENHHKELFSTELYWEIFCCITSNEYNSKKRLGHATSPELKMADRDVSISHRRWLRKSWEWARYHSNDLWSISKWPL